MWANLIWASSSALNWASTKCWFNVVLTPYGVGPKLNQHFVTLLLSYSTDRILYLIGHYGQSWSSRRYWPNRGIMLAQQLRRWANINPSLCQRLAFAGMLVAGHSPGDEHQFGQFGELMNLFCTNLPRFSSRFFTLRHHVVKFSHQTLSRNRQLPCIDSTILFFSDYCSL